MPIRTTRLLGVATGAIVSVLVAQGDQTRSLGPIAWGVDPTPPLAGDIHLTPGSGEGGMAAELTIFYRPTENYEHQQVIFEGLVTGSGVTRGALDSYDPQTHAGQWVTDITRDGDPGWSTSSYSAPIEGYPGQYQKGRYYNRRFKTVHDQPGTYRATMTFVRDDGLRATAAVVVYTIGAQGDLFTSAQTYVVATDSNFTGAPANVGQFTTYQAAWNALLSLNQPRCRILLKRGQSFAGMASQSSAYIPTSILVDAWGTGAKPEITGQQTWGTNVVNTDVRIANCVVKSNYNGLGNTGTSIGILFMAGNNDVTYSNLDGDDFGGVFLNMGAACNHIAICNCRAIGFNGAGSLAGNNISFGVRGSVIQPRPDSWTMTSADQGGGFGWRNGGSSWLSDIDQCDMFARLSNSFTPLSGSVKTRTQSTIRSQTVNVAAGGHLNITRCRSEGSAVALYSPQSGGFAVTPVTQTVSFCYLSGHMDYGFSLVNTQAGGLRVIGNTFVALPNRTTIRDPQGPAPLTAFIKVQNNANHQGGTQNHALQWISNTFISLQDGPAPSIADVENSYTSTPVNSNNLRHHPFASSAAINAGEFGGPIVHVPKYIGYYSYDATTIEPITVTATHVVTLTGVSGAFNEGTTAGVVTLTAPGTVTATIAQRQTTGGVTRLWLYNVTGTIADGATVTVSGGNGGGSGTASGPMAATNFGRAWAPLFAPGSDAGLFSRIGMLGALQTTAFRGAWPQVV